MVFILDTKVPLFKDHFWHFQNNNILILKKNCGGFMGVAHPPLFHDFFAPPCLVVKGETLSLQLWETLVSWCNKTEKANGFTKYRI